MIPIATSADQFATFQGIGPAGLSGMLAGDAPARAMCRPEALRGKVSTIDRPTGLIAATALALIDDHFVPWPSHRVGIVVASPHGNHGLVRSFAKRTDQDIKSPASFAACGFNILSGVTAMAIGATGPSLVLPGRTATLSGAEAVARLFIRRGDADAVVAAYVDTDLDLKNGICLMMLVSNDELRGARTVRRHRPDSIGDFDRFLGEALPRASESWAYYLSRCFNPTVDPASEIASGYRDVR